MKKNKIIWLALFIALIAAMLIFDSKAFKQPEKLQGGFKEVAFYRNQNNAGPVVRIYAVTVKSPEGADYEGYGNAMPYTLHGNTKVYFFDKKGPAPERLKFDYPHFDTVQYDAIKVYERNGADIVSIND